MKRRNIFADKNIQIIILDKVLETKKIKIKTFLILVKYTGTKILIIFSKRSKDVARVVKKNFLK
jgi:hypothetical protein